MRQMEHSSLSCSFGSCLLQDRLLNEQKGLQDRLKQALQLRLHPKTSVDTETIADKIIGMFDDMLEASVYQARYLGCSRFRLMISIFFLSCPQTKVVGIWDMPGTSAFGAVKTHI